MKSRRIPLESEVDKYEVGKGMEDGFELFSDVDQGMDRDGFARED